jgi:hypothetical protein
VMVVLETGGRFLFASIDRKRRKMGGQPGQAKVVAGTSLIGLAPEGSGRVILALTPTTASIERSAGCGQPRETTLDMRDLDAHANLFAPDIRVPADRVAVGLASPSGLEKTPFWSRR